ncbi:DivIVA domain-containing protein [Vallitaleaceae bacterium 9-2]
MLTPLDIESKEFSSSLGGYSKAEVKQFMNEILTSYEKIYKENIEMKDKINMLNEGIQYYKTIENTLQNTLLLAEKTAEETRSAARSRAESIEKEAEINAEKIIKGAKEEIHQIDQSRQLLIKAYDASKIQIRQFLKAQMEMVERNELEIRQNDIISNQALEDVQKIESELENHEHQQMHEQEEGGFEDDITENDDRQYE